MNIRRALEKHGFIVKKEDNGWDISQFTPAGEDWHIFLFKLGEFESYVEGFDPEEEFENLFRGRPAGLPSVPELWKDQEWKQNLLNKIWEEIQ